MRKAWLLIALLFALMIPHVSAQIGAPVTGHVSVDTLEARITATPKILYGSGYVYINITSKVLDGNLDLCFGFESTIAEVKSLEIYRERVEYIDKNLTLIKEWIPVGNTFTKTVFKFERVDSWFHVASTLSRQVNYAYRLYIDVSPELGYNRHEYYIAFKPSGDTYQEAVNEGRFHFLDPWIDSGWRYRKSLLILNATGAGTNYPIRINAHSGSGSDSGEDIYFNDLCQSDFDDLRFADDNGSTLLDYWIESESGGNGYIWFEVQDDLSSSNQTIYIYYGNDAVSDISDGETTFTFFDDFNRANNSTVGNGWTEDEGGEDAKILSNILYLSEHENQYNHIERNQTLVDLALHGQVKRVSGDLGAVWCPSITLYWAGLDDHFRVGSRYGAANDQKVYTLRNVAGGLTSDNTVEDTSSQWIYYRIKLNGTISAEYSTTDDNPLENWYTTMNISRPVSFSGAPLTLIIGKGWTFDPGYLNPDFDNDFATIGDSGVMYMDNVFLRKYVNPEPSLGVTGSVESEYYITFNVNVGGQFRVDNATVVNGSTQINAYENQTLELVAVVANSSIIFVSFNWTGGSNTTNPYDFTVSANDTVWCYFDDAPEETTYIFAIWVINISNPEPNENVLLNGSFSSGSSAISTYSWNFGDGNTSSIAEPTKAWGGNNTSYDVQLTVSNGDGSDSLNQTITVVSYTYSPGGAVTYTSAVLIVAFFILVPIGVVLWMRRK